MCNSSSAADRPTAASFALLVGIDWAQQKHDVQWLTPDGRTGHRIVEHSAEVLESLLAELVELAGGKEVAIILERSRGALQYALLNRAGFTVYPVDPKQFAAYRQSFTSGGAKADRTDAALLVRMLAERADRLRPWRPDDEPTRRLAHLCQARRQLVDEATRLKQQLQAWLRMGWPLLLELAAVESPFVEEVLRRFEDLTELQRAHPKTLRALVKRHLAKSDEKIDELVQRIRKCPLLVRDRPILEATHVQALVAARQLIEVLKGVEDLERRIDQAMAAHPDAALFRALPGTGRALAPRLLTAFGSDRERYADAEEVTVVSGIAPVERQSGKSRVVVRRRACSRYLKQTFHEFADHARKWCPWSRAYYAWQRAKNVGHHAAVRKLASRWIRILFRLWKSRTPYDPGRYLQALQDHHHPCLAYLPPPSPAPTHP